MRTVDTVEQDFIKSKEYEYALAEQLGGTVTTGKHPWDIEADGKTYEVKTESYSWKPGGNMFLEMGDLRGDPPADLFELVMSPESTGPFRKLQDGVDFWLHGMVSPKTGDLKYCQFSVESLCTRLCELHETQPSSLTVKAIGNQRGSSRYVTYGYAVQWSLFTDLKLRWLTVTRD